MKPKFTVELLGARGKELERLLGTCMLAIKSPEGEFCNLKGSSNQFCVFLDITGLTPKQLDDLCGYFAQKSGDPLLKIKHDILLLGVPIRLGADAIVHVPANYKAPPAIDVA
jgi:hypothetical protein